MIGNQNAENCSSWVSYAVITTDRTKLKLSFAEITEINWNILQEFSCPLLNLHYFLCLLTYFLLELDYLTLLFLQNVKSKQERTVEARKSQKSWYFREKWCCYILEQLHKMYFAKYSQPHLYSQTWMCWLCYAWIFCVLTLNFSSLLQFTVKMLRKVKLSSTLYVELEFVDITVKLMVCNCAWADADLIGL